MAAPLKLIGLRFGKLIVLSRGSKKNHTYSWNCKCDCGNFTTVIGNKLISGHTRSCGCLKKENKGAPYKYRTDLIGKRFGFLLVLEEAGRNKHGSVMWKCLCECGSIVIIKGKNLRSGHTKSCGCAHGGKIVSSHILSKTRLRGIRNAMIRRCYNPKDASYKYYGAKGITVCPAWLNDPDTFYDWVLSVPYNDSLTIDRIDNDGNYCPENCRWATAQEQSNNTSQNRLLTYNNVTLNVKQWSRATGISDGALYYRIKKGWPVEKILTQPSERKKP